MVKNTRGAEQVQAQANKNDRRRRCTGEHVPYGSPGPSPSLLQVYQYTRIAISVQCKFAGLIWAVLYGELELEGHVYM